MSIFSDLQNATGVYVGGTVVSGVLLAVTSTIVLFVAIEMMLNSGKGKDSHSGPEVFLISMAVGIILTTIVGWLPVWAVVFIGIFILYEWNEKKRGAIST